MVSLPGLQDADVKGKRVFVRCDFDARLSEQSTINNQQLTIVDDARLVSCVSTIEYLLENNCSVIAAGHLRRPEGWDIKYSLMPIVSWFAQQFDSQIKETEMNGFKGWEIKRNFYILENLRFYKEEKDPTTPSGQEFVHKLASLAEIYVNEAFGSSHRKHASIVGIPKILPHFAGFHLAKEIKVLSAVLENPERPLTIIIGGAKMETKLPIVAKMQAVADHILIGGKLTDQDIDLIEKEKAKSQRAEIIIASLNEEGTDIASESLMEFENIISKSGMLVWNGPMGYLEGGFEDTTLNLAKAIINSDCYKIAGGGDTVAFLNKHKLFDKFDFVSMGGGAMLEFLSGAELPGLQALQN